MYQALYRKYRPRTFSDVVGQDHITRILRHQVETGRTSHAYLFVGSRGTGKTTCAKILSRALNCHHTVNGDPCNECDACRGIESGSVLDVVEIDAASNNGVDNIRAIRDEAIYSPASVRRRVYIIDEVHMLSTAAFNALLKIMEEPPEHLVFILATTDLRKIPPTILSRCQRFSFKRIMAEDIVSRLMYVAEKEGITLTDGAAALLARLSDGAMRDALSLLDQCMGDGIVDEERVLSAVGLSSASDTAELWKSMISGDAAGAVNRFDALYLGGADPVSLMGSVLSLCRDILMVKIAPQGTSSLICGTFGVDALNSLGAGTDTGMLLAASDMIQSALLDQKNIKDQRTAAEVLFIKLTGVLSGAVRIAASASAPVPAPPPVSRQDVSPAAPVRAAAPQKPAPKFEDDPVPWDDVPPPDDKDAPPEPIPEPAPRTIAAPASSTAGASADNAWWDTVLSETRGKVGMAYTFLSDRVNVTPVLTENRLTITVSNDFVKNMLDNAQVKTAVSQSASGVLGRSVTVSVTVGSAPSELREDKLDELSRFSNIKFE